MFLTELLLTDDVASSADVLHMSTHLHVAFVPSHHMFVIWAIDSHLSFLQVNFIAMLWIGISSDPTVLAVKMPETKFPFHNEEPNGHLRSFWVIIDIKALR